MKLDDFITKTLTDIENGMKEAEGKTSKGYHIENGGVHFDVAVTVMDSTDTSVEGKATAGIVQVIGAGVNAALKTNQENSEASRIQFTIYVPSRTKQEIERDIQSAQNNQRNFSYM